MVHVRFLDLEIVEPGDRIELDIAHFGTLADHLFVDLGFSRHIDHDVALKQSLAAQAAAGLEPALFIIAGFDLGKCAEVFSFRDNAVLGKFAFCDIDLAAPANSAAAADAVDVNAEVTRRGQHRGAAREPATFAGRSEYDQSVAFVLLAHALGPVEYHGCSQARRRRRFSRSRRRPAASA